MGQYYKGVVGNKIYDNYLIYKDEKKYTLAKLMEHSYINNLWVNTIAKQIYKNPQKVAWVGDYSNECTSVFDKLDVSYEDVWNTDGDVLKYARFSCKKRYLVNHTTEEYVAMGKMPIKDGWQLHPLPLLTAVGNGGGGGDYYGKDEEYVGCWAGDVLSVEDEPPMEYSEVTFDFEPY